MNNLFQKKTPAIAAFLGIIFILSLIPALLLSFYVHPNLDDYTYGNGVHQVILNGGSFIDILSAVKTSIVYNYYGWQGTFSAIALFSLHPGVFSEDLYFLTTFILLGGLVGSTFFLLYTILVTWLKQPKSNFCVIAFLTLLIQVHFVPYVSEAFFWFNGASYYTLFYSLSLIFFALVVRLILACDAQKKRMWNALVAIPLGFFIGGGNYSTCLFVACMLVIMLIFLLFQKHPSFPYVLVISLAFAVAFVLSMIAPGNSVRGSYFTPMNPIAAILASLLTGLGYAGEWTSMEVLLAIFMATPLLMKAAEDCKWTFRYPLLVMIIAFGLYACLMTPPLYAMAYEGDGRQINLYYYTYILMVLFDVFYLCGWFVRVNPQVLSSAVLFSLARRYVMPIMFVVTLLFAGAFIGKKDSATFTVCASTLINGTAEEYDAVVTASIQQLRQTGEECVLTRAIPESPAFAYHCLTDDPNYWVNAAWASYYGCESVIYMPDQ